MFVLEKTYDVDELIKCNMHTHTHFSLCAKPEMILKDMINQCEKDGITTLAITDHNDPGSDIDVLANSNELRRQLSEIETNVRVLIGSELSAYGIGKYADSDELNKSLDYRNYSHVHYHLSTWTQPEDRSPSGYAKDMLAVLSQLFDDRRADCIAHPFGTMKLKFFSDEEKLMVLNSITDNELGDILEKGEKSECAFEIHKSSFMCYPQFYRRFWNIGKEVGVHFNIGTDAHNLMSLTTKDFGEQLKNIIK